MGILTDLGPVQTYEQTQPQQRKLKIMAIKQFLHLIKRFQDMKKPTDQTHIKWGVEIQGHFLKVNNKNQLELDKEPAPKEYKNLGFSFTMEYGSWMFQMVPSLPYNTNCNYYDIINSINQKYEKMHSQPRMALTIPGIPFLGVSTSPTINNQVTASKYIDDSHITDFPRFKSIEQFIRKRRGSSVSVYVPLFKDSHTEPSEIALTEPRPDSIHLDAAIAGMGNCCLQCTTSTIDLNHARYVYDQLNVLSPLFLALSAGTPYFKGKLSDWDVRWKVISQCCDDRTQEERDQSNPAFIPTSRYGEANYYIWDNPINREEYNDFYTGIKEEDLEHIRQIQLEEGIPIDKRLAFHIANIIKRDFPLTHQSFKEMDSSSSLLFEVLNGTNWNSVRLKIPTEDVDCWRVELRTMEVQLTADENAALSLLVHLFTRVLHDDFSLNMYIPISLLRENFARAHRRSALLTQKFYFRVNVRDEGTPCIQELYIGEIFFGKGFFKGIFRELEDRVCCSKEGPHVVEVLKRVKKFLFEKVTGGRLTLAQWIRRFVASHPVYTRNSVLSKQVMDDLLVRLHQISIGDAQDDNFKRVFPGMKGVGFACSFVDPEPSQVLAI